MLYILLNLGTSTYITSLSKVDVSSNPSVIVSTVFPSKLSPTTSITPIFSPMTPAFNTSKSFTDTSIPIHDGCVPKAVSMETIDLTKTVSSSPENNITTFVVPAVRSVHSSPLRSCTGESNIIVSPMQQSPASKNLFPLAFSGTSLLSDMPQNTAIKTTQNRRKQKLTVDKLRSEYKLCEEVVPQVVIVNGHKRTASQMLKPHSSPVKKQLIKHTKSVRVARPNTPTKINSLCQDIVNSCSTTPAKSGAVQSDRMLKKSPPIMSAGVAAALKKILDQDAAIKMEPDDYNGEKQMEYERMWDFNDSSQHPCE